MKRFLVAVFVLASMVLVVGKERSPEWNKVRKAHIKKHPACALCGSTKSVQVHHIQPFHLHPELELESSNLITLCTSKYWGVNCHIVAGHSGNFKLENNNVMEDVENLKEIVERTRCWKEGCMNNDEFLTYTKKMKKRTQKYMCETYNKCGKEK